MSEIEDIINDKNNSWTEFQEDLIKKWYRESMGYYWKHNRISKKYSFRDKLIGLPATVANAIAGTVIFANLQDQGSCENNLYIQLVVAVIILIDTILFAIQNFLNLSQLSEKHTNSANKYKSLANVLETELSLPRGERINGKIFLKQAQKRFNELLEVCPNLPESIEELYKLELNKNDDIEFLREIIIDKSEIKEIKDKTDKTDKLKKKIKNNYIFSDGDDEENKDNDNNENDKVSDSSLSDNDSNKNNLQRKIDEEIKNITMRENIRNLEDKRRISRFFDNSY